MTRRGLFAALAALPFVGRFVKQREPVLLFDSKWSHAKTFTFGENLKTLTGTVSGERRSVTFIRDSRSGVWLEVGRATWPV